MSSYEFSAEASSIQPLQGDARGTCRLFSTGGFSTESGDGTRDYAYLIASPAIDSPDTLTAACPDVRCPVVGGPTECSQADKQLFQSQGGEVSLKLHLLMPLPN